jgi:hypothetical protein
MSTTLQARRSLTWKIRLSNPTAFRRSAGLTVFSQQEPQGFDVQFKLPEHPEELRILHFQLLQPRSRASETSIPPNFAFHR